MKRQTPIIKNATYFITTTVTKFTPIFHEKELAKIIIDNLIFYTSQFNAKIHGFVIMPNHVHLLLSIGEKGNISQLIGRIKEFSAKQIIKHCEDNHKNKLLEIFSESARTYCPDHKYQVWQSRFDDLVITNQETFIAKLQYIHYNPCREQWKLADNPADYEFSSARFYELNEDCGIPIFPSPVGG